MTASTENQKVISSKWIFIINCSLFTKVTTVWVSTVKRYTSISVSNDFSK